jgi:hypothetical protein
MVMVSRNRSRDRVCAVLLFGSLSLLAACEQMYGICRTGHIEKIPDPACIRDAIGLVQGVRIHHAWSWPRGWKDGDVQELSSTQVSYAGSLAIGIQLGFFRDEVGGARMSHAYLQVDSVPEPREVKEARQLMARVEEAIAMRCGVRDFAKTVMESCSGVVCD